MIQIKRGNTIVWEGNAEGKQHRSVMQQDRVTVRFKSPTLVDFKIGDIIEVYGDTYKLNLPESIRQTNTLSGYEYDIEFEALYYDLGKWEFRALDKNNELKEGDVYLMSDARGVINLIVMNANRTDSGWTVGQVDDTEETQYGYNNVKLLTVLQDVADKNNLEFWVDGKTINLTRRSPDTGLVLEYGKGKGLYSITRSKVEKPRVNTLTVQGGNRNIPVSYGFRRLQPTGGNPLTAPNITGDIIEETVTFGDVYPRLIAEVKSVPADNKIRSSDINFDLSETEIETEIPKIAFVSGQLSSWVFGIDMTKWNNSTKEIEFVPVEDDPAYPEGVPSPTRKPAVGDKFVLLDIAMPKAYIETQEDRLKALGEQYLADANKETYNYSVSITPKFALENDLELILGGLVQVKMAGRTDELRVSGYTRDILRGYVYEAELSEKVGVSEFVRQALLSDRFAEEALSVGRLSDSSGSSGYAEKAGYAERAGTADSATTAGYADISGHANTADHAETATHADEADHADTADFAEEAGNAQKWNDLEQPEYLTQPVRPEDTVEFAGVITPEASITGKLLIPQIPNSSGNGLSKSSEYLLLGNSKVWAGNSDLWNGLSQPDYLTQPVRPADSPKFKGVSSQSFASGFAGHGYRVSQDANGNYTIEADRLIIRKDFNVYELNVEKIRASNGSIWVSDGAKIDSVTASGSKYICYIDTDGDSVAVPFSAGDIIRCQVFEGTRLKYYTAEVKSVTNESFTVEILEGFDVPEAGDEVVRIGNRTNANRQGALYLTASDSGAPFLDVIDGVTDASLAGKTKARLGKLDGIVDPDFGALSGYGLYGQNVYLKGNIQVIGGNAATTDQVDDLADQIHDQEIYQEYSADGISWHSTYQEGTDLFMRLKKGNGAWTDKMRIVGIPGKDGEDGAGIEISGSVSSYSALPTNLGTGDAGKAYMNLADGKLYIWDGTSFPPNGQGIEFRGPKGEPGAETYMWVQYADDAQGNGMSDSSEGKLYIGLAFNKATSAPSNNPSDYEWSEMPQNLEIGGRNLLIGTSEEWKSISISFYNAYPFGGGTSSPTITDVEEGENYVFSARVRPNNQRVRLHVRFFNETGSTVDNTYSEFIDSGDEGRLYLAFTVPENAVSFFLAIRREFNDGSTIVDYKKAQLESGNKATDWSPAPEDYHNELDVFRSETETEFAVLDGKIESKVSQTDFNDLDQRVGSAETSIVQNADAIELRATKNEVSQDISSAKNDAISDANSYTDGKVSDVEGDVSSIETRVTTAETNITQNASAISLKADQTQVTQIVGDVNSLETRVSSAELKIEPDAIRATVKSQTEQIVGDAVDGIEIGGRNLLSGTSADYEEGSINAFNFYPFGSAFRVNVDDSKSYVLRAYIRNPDDRVRMSVRFFDSNDDRFLDDVGGNYIEDGESGYSELKFTPPEGAVSIFVAIRREENFTHTTYFEYKELKLEEGTKATAWGLSDEDITSSIDTLRTETFTEFSVLDGKIESKVSQTDFNDLDQRVGSAETSIVQNADDIELRATKNEIESSLSVSANQISLLSKTVSLTGAVTFDSLKSGSDGQSIIDGGYIKADLLDVQQIVVSGGGATTAQLNTAKQEAISTASQDATSKSNSALDSAKTYTDTLGNSLGDMAFENVVEVAKLGTTVIQGGYIKTELLDVEEIFAKNITATGQITATNLRVSGSSEIGDFTIQNGYLTNTSNKGGVLLQSSASANRMYAGIGSAAADIAIPGTWGGELPAAFGNNRQSFDENIAMYLEAKNGTKNIAVHVASGVARLKGLALGVQNISGQATISKDTVVAFVINANNNTNIYMPSEPETGQLVIVKNLIPNNGGFILQHNLSGGGQFVGIDGNSHGAFQFRSGSRTVRGYVFSGSNWQQIIDA